MTTCSGLGKAVVVFQLIVARASKSRCKKVQQQGFTPQGLDSRAQGRAAHPGNAKPFVNLPRRGWTSSMRALVQPLRGRFLVGDSVTQGALRDPGLRHPTPAGVNAAPSQQLPARSLRLPSIHGTIQTPLPRHLERCPNRSAVSTNSGPSTFCFTTGRQRPSSVLQMLMNASARFGAVNR